MVNFKFYGTKGHEPRIWSVGKNNFGDWAVMESYDGGKQWTVNCLYDSEEEAWDFISAWVATFYEGT